MNESINKIAQKLKENQTKSEIVFGRYLKNAGIYFKEQEVICGYVPDFYFPHHDHKIIELDGKCHEAQKERDIHRDKKLLDAGFRVLRVPSRSVFSNVAWLMETVSEFLGMPVPAAYRRKIRKMKKVKMKKKKTAPWAKVPKLTKDHLPVRRNK